MNWINVKEVLPNHKEKVIILVHNSDIQVAIFYKGKSKEENINHSYSFCDEDGNNLVPYAWKADGGPMKWFGQDVSHWMPLPNLPTEFDNSYEKQPLYLFLIYLNGIISFFLSFFIGLRFKAPYLFNILSNIRGEEKTIVTYVLPYVFQIMLLFGLIFTIVGEIIIVPYCKYKFNIKTNL